MWKLLGNYIWCSYHHCKFYVNIFVISIAARDLSRNFVDRIGNTWRILRITSEKCAPNRPFDFESAAETDLTRSGRRLYFENIHYIFNKILWNDILNFMNKHNYRFRSKINLKIISFHIINCVFKLVLCLVGVWQCCSCSWLVVFKISRPVHCIVKLKKQTTQIGVSSTILEWLLKCHCRFYLKLILHWMSRSIFTLIFIRCSSTIFDYCDSTPKPCLLNITSNLTRTCSKSQTRKHSIMLLIFFLLNWMQREHRMSSEMSGPSSTGSKKQSSEGKSKSGL